tara:strand:+ start:1633 stop:1872 length:240 start_codon:yes stop_codon:yes gene_type:complete
MVLLQTELEKKLDTFRKRFRSIKVMQYQDCLVYSYNSIKNATLSCADANFLIAELGLDLVAIHSQNSPTFLVQNNEVEA